MNGTVQPDDDLPPLPPRLAAAFSRLQATSVFVPPAVDAAVLAAAREHFDGRRISGLPTTAAALASWLAPWLRRRAVMVSLLAMATLVLWTVLTKDPAQAAKADIDHSGHVDILDALALSRSLAADAPGSPAWDVNGDGLVDQRDVAAVASQAVRLTNGPDA